MEELLFHFQDYTRAVLFPGGSCHISLFSHMYTHINCRIQILRPVLYIRFAHTNWTPRNSQLISFQGQESRKWFNYIHLFFKLTICIYVKNDIRNFEFLLFASWIFNVGQLSYLRNWFLKIHRIHKLVFTFNSCIPNYIVQWHRIKN